MKEEVKASTLEAFAYTILKSLLVDIWDPVMKGRTEEVYHFTQHWLLW